MGSGKGATEESDQSSRAHYALAHQVHGARPDDDVAGTAHYRK